MTSGVTYKTPSWVRQRPIANDDDEAPARPASQRLKGSPFLALLLLVLPAITVAQTQTVIYVPLTYTAPGSTQGALTASWTAPGDDSIAGQATSYDLRVSRSTITSSTFTAASRVATSPPQPAGALESVIVPNLVAGLSYSIAIKTMDDAGNVSPLSNVTRGTARLAAQRAIAARMIGRDRGGFTWTQNFYGTGQGGAQQPPPAPGQSQTIYVAMWGPWTSCPDPEGVDLALSLQAPDGSWGDPIAGWRLVACLSDTNYCLDRNRFQRPTPAGGTFYATWTIDPAEPRFLPLEAQGDVQSDPAIHQRICELFRIWCRGGLCISCL